MSIELCESGIANRRRRMKTESRQIPQKLAVRLKFVYCLVLLFVHVENPCIQVCIATGQFRSDGL